MARIPERMWGCGKSLERIRGNAKSNEFSMDAPDGHITVVVMDSNCKG
jgi:hypothetical protein